MSNQVAAIQLNEIEETPLRDTLMADARWQADLNYCMSCGKCLSVCPLHGYSEWDPRKVVRLVLLGLEEEVIDSDFMALILVSATGVNRLPDIEIRPRWFGVVFSLAVRADRPVPGSIQTDLWVWPRRTVRPASCHRGV